MKQPQAAAECAVAVVDGGLYEVRLTLLTLQ
jgi:hypothetical protein